MNYRGSCKLAFSCGMGFCWQVPLYAKYWCENDSNHLGNCKTVISFYE